MSEGGTGHIRTLADLRRAEGESFGGKSVSLGELLAAEIPVPPGFALSSAAYGEFLGAAGLEERIAGELHGLDVEDLGALREASEEIAELVRGTPFPDDLRGSVAAAYARLAAETGVDEPAVAVRSSALGEDSHEATFAGQQETYLWIRGADGVSRAVHDCWASLYTPEAISYRARMSAPIPSMGVTVQLMVDAVVSGVLFTCNPVSGDPSIVAVNASWGLGLAVVGGEVTPDEYRLSKVTGELLHRAISSKDVEYLPDPAGGGTMRAEVAAERRERACLGEEELEALLSVGRRVERHFGSPQDIEWALAREGSLPDRLFVLQSRPVTTVPKKSDPPKAQSAMSLVMQTFGARKGDTRER